MPRLTSSSWLCLPALALSGCLSSNGDVELLEARLRDQQDLVARYEKTLQSNQQELEIARSESQQLRRQIADGGKSPILPEHADVLLRAEKLAFHSMMTGARDMDGAPGEERLNVVLTPQSGSGETVRLIGAVEIEALDLSRPSGQQQLGRWSFTPEQARDHWHHGFLASGLQFDLPCEAMQHSREVVLHAKLATADGRRLDASHKVTVQPATVAASGAPRPAVPPKTLPKPTPAAEPRLLPAGVRTSELVPSSPPSPFPGQPAIQQVSAQILSDSPPFPDAAREGRPFPTGAEATPSATDEPAAWPTITPQPGPTPPRTSAAPDNAQARSLAGTDFLKSLDGPPPPPLPRPRGRVLKRLPATTSDGLVGFQPTASPASTLALSPINAAEPFPCSDPACQECTAATCPPATLDPAPEQHAAAKFLPMEFPDSSPALSDPADFPAVAAPAPAAVPLSTPASFPTSASATPDRPIDVSFTAEAAPAFPTTTALRPAAGDSPSFPGAPPATPPTTSRELIGVRALPPAGKLPEINASKLLAPDSAPARFPAAPPLQTSDRWTTDQLPVVR
jgi:hypothetical protein